MYCIDMWSQHQPLGAISPDAWQVASRIAGERIADLKLLGQHDWESDQGQQLRQLIRGPLRDPSMLRPLNDAFEQLKLSASLHIAVLHMAI